MKRILSVIWVICFVLIMQSCKNGDKEESVSTDKQDSNKTVTSNKVERDAPDKPYPYESGMIKYKYEGDYNGTQTVYFKDFGKWFRIEEEYVNEVSPLKDKVSQVFIGTPEKFYFIDRISKMGYTSAGGKAAEEVEGNLLRDFTTIGIDSTMRKNGYSPSGEETISGKKCTIYSSEDGDSKYCFWRGINVRTEINLQKQVKYSITAEEIDEKKDLEDNVFDPPSDIRFMEYNEYIQAVTKNKL
jgi:hypothetical protein